MVNKILYEITVQLLLYQTSFEMYEFPDIEPWRDS